MKAEPLIPSALSKAPRSAHPTEPTPPPVPAAPSYTTPAGRTRKSLYLSTPTAQALDDAAEALWRAGAGHKAAAYEALIHCGLDNLDAAYKRLGVKRG